jgi:hypothetical protein
LTTRNIILIGGPDTGKTGFLARLWIALQARRGALTPSRTPDEIKYIEDVVHYLHQGSFPPRTDQNLEADQGPITIPLGLEESPEEKIAELLIPDVSGEIWKKAVETTELAPEWMAQLEDAFGVLLFVRVLSDLNVDPLDWVNSAELMEYQGDNAQSDKMPTQVMLCEFLRFLELKLPDRTSGRKPRIAVIITAWDLLDNDSSATRPRAYLEKEYPLFAGRLADLDRFDVAVFAISILGGDLQVDEEFREELLLNSDLESAGFIRFDRGGTVEEETDFTLPVAWVIGTRDMP